jgi:hypothetical protein
MKQAILCAVFIAASILSFGQGDMARREPPVQKAGSLIPDFNSLENAGQIAVLITQVIGLRPDFEIKTARVDNLEAVISHRKRYIYYNPGFIDGLNTATGDKWAAIALLAHEIGHHLSGHTLGKSSNRVELEKEADEFAGFILAKLGASLEEAQLVMNYIAKTEQSKTHPARKDRITAIATGWNKAIAHKEGATEMADLNPAGKTPGS